VKITSMSYVAVCREVTPSVASARTSVVVVPADRSGARVAFGSGIAAWRPQASDLTYGTVGSPKSSVTGDSKQSNGNVATRRTQFVPRDLDHRRPPV